MHQPFPVTMPDLLWNGQFRFQKKTQQKTIRSVGQEWYRQDKDAVEAWLPESGLSEDLQKSIQESTKEKLVAKPTRSVNF